MGLGCGYARIFGEPVFEEATRRKAEEERRREEQRKRYNLGLDKTIEPNNEKGSYEIWAALVNRPMFTITL